MCCGKTTISQPVHSRNASSYNKTNFISRNRVIQSMPNFGKPKVKINFGRKKS